MKIYKIIFCKFSYKDNFIYLYVNKTINHIVFFTKLYLKKQKNKNNFNKQKYFLEQNVIDEF